MTCISRTTEPKRSRIRPRPKRNRGFIILLVLAACLLNPINANLKRPTLVGIGQCETLPTIRLPLYWSKLYAPDGKDHHGPKEVITIISDGTPNANKDEQEEAKVPSPDTEQEEDEDAKAESGTKSETKKESVEESDDKDSNEHDDETSESDKESSKLKGAKDSDGQSDTKGTNDEPLDSEPKDQDDEENEEDGTKLSRDDSTKSDETTDDTSGDNDDDDDDDGRDEVPVGDDSTAETEDDQESDNDESKSDDAIEEIQTSDENSTADDSPAPDPSPENDAEGEGDDEVTPKNQASKGNDSISDEKGDTGKEDAKDITADDVKHDDKDRGKAHHKATGGNLAVRTFPKKNTHDRGNDHQKGSDSTQYTAPPQHGDHAHHPRTLRPDDKNIQSASSVKDTDEESFGWVAPDGTIRASIDDVARDARVKVVVFYYADLRQCSVLATDLSALVDEVNAEVAASDQKDVFGDQAVSAVIINHHWPITCDQYPEKCDPTKDASTLQESQWQGKLTSAAPKLPILQDTARVDAFDSVFGTYYTDVLLYVDDRVYQYFPSALAIAHSKVLAAHVDEAHKEVLNDWKRFKNILLEAVHIPFVWCENGQTNVSPADEPLIASNYDYDQRMNDTSSSILDSIPIDNYVDPDSDVYEIVEGFMLAAIATFGTLIICLIWKCCFSWAEYCCCDLPIHKHRKMGLEYDGLGEFRPLASGADRGDDRDVEDWSDNDDEYSHYLEGAAEDDDEDDRLEYGLSPEVPDEEAPHTIERLSDPQSVAEAFFRRQEEVELEMRAFRQDADNDKIQGGMSLDHDDDQDESSGQEAPILIDGQLDLEKEMERQEQELLEQEDELNESLDDDEDDGEDDDCISEEYQEDDDEDDDDLFQEFQDRPQLDDEINPSGSEVVSDTSSIRTGDRDDEMSETSGLDLEVLERKITKSVVEQERQLQQQQQQEEGENVEVQGLDNVGIAA